ncbi:MAG TPA: DUF5670 family protein [Arachidicoccus sp.]|nr:DUF5670 family protein [Arachidicoccus sp.]
MSKTLYTLGFFFVLVWIIGYTVLAAGSAIHLLFAVAFILFVISEMTRDYTA